MISRRFSRFLPPVRTSLRQQNLLDCWDDLSSVLSRRTVFISFTLLQWLVFDPQLSGIAAAGIIFRDSLHFFSWNVMTERIYLKFLLLHLDNNMLLKDRCICQESGVGSGIFFLPGLRTLAVSQYQWLGSNIPFHPLTSHDGHFSSLPYSFYRCLLRVGVDNFLRSAESNVLDICKS
ncbi:hypothetical protein M432DRAFT_252220 [Thermoascus aurantiacus ATCC 26904]